MDLAMSWPLTYFFCPASVQGTNVKLLLRSSPADNLSSVCPIGQGRDDMPSSSQEATHATGDAAGGATGTPVDEGREKASRRPMMLGWRIRRRMQISRSARLAWSGLLSTSATRLMATCGSQQLSLVEGTLTGGSCLGT